MKALKILISGGGSGGHVFPAIAIANALKQKCVNQLNADEISKQWQKALAAYELAEDGLV